MNEIFNAEDSPVEVMAGKYSWQSKALKKAKEVLKAGVNPLPVQAYVEHMHVSDVNRIIQNDLKKDSSQAWLRDYSTISEGLICDLINQGQLMGPKARAIKTNIYDDIVNHTDIVVQINHERRIAMGIDVTFHKDLKDKFGYIRKDIISGNLSTLSYTPTGTSVKIPRLLLGMQLKNFNQMARSWIQGIVPSHKLLGQLQYQVITQLLGFQVYAASIKKFSVVEALQYFVDYWKEFDKIDLRQDLRTDPVSNLIIEGVDKYF